MPTDSNPPDATNTAGNVLALELGERRRPGRPRSVGRAPDQYERARHRRVRERLEEHVEADMLVTVASATVDRTSNATIDAAMVAVASEAAALLWERRRSQAESRSSSEKVASRRCDALGRLAGLVLERAKSCPAELEVRSARFQAVVADFLDHVRAAALETLAPDVAEKFVAAYLVRLQGWESRVE